MLEKLRDILQCPECQSEIKIHPHEIVCQTCLKQFPIKNNVPLFSIEEIEKKGLITTPEKKNFQFSPYYQNYLKHPH